MQIINEEKIYIENKPRYITIFHKNKGYTLIMERFDYDGFNFYYDGNDIPDKEERKEIEEYLIDKYSDYVDWNLGY